MALGKIFDWNKRFYRIASCRYLCNPEYCQVILGGLGGFGLELADWLVLRGAKKLVLTSRTGVRNGYQASRIRYQLKSSIKLWSPFCYFRLWRSYGVDVRVSTANTATRKGCTELIREASRLGPVESIFNLAVVLQDAILENQTEITFKTSFEPKAAATTYLDEITRKHCPYLRYITLLPPPLTNFKINISAEISLCFHQFLVEEAMRVKRTMEWQTQLWKGFAKRENKMVCLD